MERYDRQQRIEGWNQDRLSEAKVCVIGSDRLADFLTVDLLALGVGELTRIGQSDYFEFDEINPAVSLECIDLNMSNLDLALAYIPPVEVVVETSNKPQSKGIAYRVATAQKTRLFSAAASLNGLSFTSTSGSLPDLLNFHQAEYTGQQGTISSIVGSAVVSDEIRKLLLPLEGDSLLPDFTYRSINEAESLDMKVLLIGAGAIGTFVGLALASKGASVTIIDFDTVEESNLNRQFLFYDAVGKKKAVSLAEKVGVYGGNFDSSVQKIVGEFDTDGYDAILSCVDNFEARLILNEVARKHKVPLVNAGSSIAAGDVNVYLPDQTACLDCQMLGLLREEVEKEEDKETGRCFQPSLIIPNQIVGGLMVNELYGLLDKEHPTVKFRSGHGIFQETAPSQCLEGCG